MKKTYIVDTSVFIFDPHCLKSKKFEGNDILIPVQILEELDKLKKGFGDAAKNARVSIRQLDEIGDGIHEGIKLENKSFVKIDVGDYGKIGEDSSYNDNKILSCAVNCKKKNKVLLTRDINLRVRARAQGIIAEDYSEDKKDTDEFYSGIISVQNDIWIQEILEKGFIDLKKGDIELYPNQCVILKDNEGHEIALGRKVGDKIKQVKKVEAWGISGRDTSQIFALDALMDTTPLVTMLGSAGSGKTLLSLAAGLELVLNKRKYNKLIIYKPAQVLGGQDIGYLPGNLMEKLVPTLGNILDNLEVLFNNGDKSNKKQKSFMDTLQMFMDKDLIELNSLAYIRGRSINNAFIILDECQNLTEQDAKTILSRASVGTKMVCLGDIEQIDTKNLDANSNAISCIAEAFKVSKLASHITLTTCHRSELANEAIKLLK